jgi:hypothetical protein
MQAGIFVTVTFCAFLNASVLLSSHQDWLVACECSCCSSHTLVVVDVVKPGKKPLALVPPLLVVLLLEVQKPEKMYVVVSFRVL